jgi:glycosyltransferase involved in cell wall biosynthesis
MTSNALWVVMPAYNEEEALPLVVDEWVAALRAVVPAFTMLVVNDGSKDRTEDVLQQLAARVPELRVLSKLNSGHGQSCMVGYRTALAAGAEWVLQIDSDGQCDPVAFAEFWRRAQAGRPVVFGFRRHRGDGVVRQVISRVVSLVVLAGAGRYVRDANVPYRLLRADVLHAVIDQIPSDFYLANCLLSALVAGRDRIDWVDIAFRARLGGTPSVRTWAFAREGRRLFVQLRAARRSG